jgi:hypothetical protein
MLSVTVPSTDNDYHLMNLRFPYDCFSNARSENDFIPLSLRTFDVIKREELSIAVFLIIATERAEADGHDPASPNLSPSHHRLAAQFSAKPVEPQQTALAICNFHTCM